MAIYQTKVRLVYPLSRLQLLVAEAALCLQAFIATVHHLVVRRCALWPSSSPADIILHRVGQANSNYVYIVRNTKIDLTSTREPHSVVLRLYGKMNVMFDRREEERVSVALSEMGMIPRFYAVFANGRMEPYIEHGSVSAAQFRRMSTAVVLVQHLRRIHELP